MGSRHVVIVAGTRPEAIKTAPLILAARDRSGLAVSLLATGQHDLPFDAALAEFGLTASRRLPPPARDPSPDVMLGHLVTALAPELERLRPALVLVQGDTTSAYAGALAAQSLGIPVGHVEAGLRSGDFANPWPEERNRVAIDALSALLFAPNAEAAARLATEPEIHGAVHVTGNTGIDALEWMRARLVPARPALGGEHRILLTCHRRESFGEGIAAICRGALRLAARGDVRILCPVHSNSAVAEPVRALLGKHPAITLVDGLGYRAMVEAMTASRLILTDSGGIQEEATALGIPTLVLRGVTERQEGVASGNLVLVGTDPDRIVAAANRLFDDPAAHAAMAVPHYPFGRRGASTKILDHIEQYFSASDTVPPPLPSRPVWTRDGAPKEISHGDGLGAR